VPTVITKSIGTTGRDYSTIASWEAAITADLVTADEQWVGQCYNDSEFTITATIIIGGQTTDATRNIILETGSGQSFRDHADKATNPLKYDVSKGVGVRTTSNYTGAIQVTSRYVTVRYLQIKTADLGGSNRVISLEGVGDSAIVGDSLICEGFKSEPVFLFTTAKLINSVIILRLSGSGNGFRWSYPLSGALIAGCTIVRPNGLTIAGSGISRPNGSSNAEVKNTAVFGFTDFADATISGDYNASDDATNIPGANSNGALTYSQQFEDYSNSTSDFRANDEAGGGDLKFGTPDSTNTPDDIIGTTRNATTPWVGCWEVPAAADYVLSASAGSFVETGSDATLKHGYLVSASAGSFVETGSDASLSATRRVSASAGSFVETGSDASLSTTRRVSASAGSFVETGSDASLEHGYLISASAGSFVETGSDASLSATRRVSVSAGSFVETGFDATLEHGYLVSASAGSFVETGSDAELIHGGNKVLVADSGLFVWVGSDATLSVTRLISALAGSFVETGFDATLEHGYLVSAISWSYTITVPTFFVAVGRPGRSIFTSSIHGGPTKSRITDNRTDFQ